MNGLSRRILAVAVTGLFGFSLPAAADTPKVVNARIIKLGKTSYEFQVTVQHVDASWDHFADRWEIIGPGGRVLGTRVLYHPHIGERQFTRKLRGVTIPKGSNTSSFACMTSCTDMAVKNLSRCRRVKAAIPASSNKKGPPRGRPFHQF